MKKTNIAWICVAVACACLLTGCVENLFLAQFVKSKEKSETIVKIPTANPQGGTYTAAQSVSLSSETEGATIYYTLDSTYPSISSPKYETPVLVTPSEAGTRLRAIAVKENMLNSAIMTETYRYQVSGVVLHTISFDSNGGSDVLSLS
jgi:hypothetical protein